MPGRYDEGRTATPSVWVINMVCLPWWALLVVLLSAVALGFVLHFGWHWWLLSGPEDPRGGPR
jgi:hypothetical protein